MTVFVVLISLFSLTVLLSFLGDNKQSKYDCIYLFVGIVLVILSVIVDKSMLPDYNQYIEYFNKSLNGDIYIEPTFLVVAYIVKVFFGNNVFGGFALYLLLGILVKLVAIKKLTNLCFLSLAFYISSYWLYHEMIQIRTGVASAFFLMSIKPLYEKKFKPFAFYTLIAILFHYSAIIIIPLWFISKDLKNRFLYILLIPFCFLMNLLKIDLINIVYFLPMPDIFLHKLEVYTAIAQYGGDRGMLSASEYDPFISWYLLKAIIAITLWIFIKKIYIHNKYAVLLLKIYTIGVAFLWCMPSLPVVATRCSEFLTVVQIVLVPLFIYVAIPRKSLLIVPIILGITWIYWNVNSFL